MRSPFLGCCSLLSSLLIHTRQWPTARVGHLGNVPLSTCPRAGGLGGWHTAELALPAVHGRQAVGQGGCQRLLTSGGSGAWKQTFFVVVQSEALELIDLSKRRSRVN